MGSPTFQHASNADRQEEYYKYNSGVSGGTAQRSVVSGSSRTVGSFTFYRPQLSMQVTNFSLQTDEWGAVVSWTLDAEEV